MTQTVDGRTARSARTREAVVTAVLELVREGSLRPTAKEIAARAGISLRSVYVHFDDLEDLFDAAGGRQTEEIAHLLYAIDPALDLPARIDEVVRQRSAIWEALAPVRQAALLWESSSSNLRERTQQINRRAVRDLDRIFAVELEGHPADRRAIVLEALHVASSAGAWQVLRAERELSVEDAGRVVATSLTSLLKAAR